MIYYVEDDMSIRELVVYTLKNTGFQALGFEDGKSLYPGLDAFQKWLRPDDIICWWHQEANDLFNMFIKIRLHHAARLYSDEEN